MARRLVFGTNSSPPPLKLWTATKGNAHTRWLPDDEFETAARKHGMSPDKGAFAVWPQRWWQQPQIFLRAKRLDLFGHEVRHIETRSNFHNEE